MRHVAILAGILTAISWCFAVAEQNPDSRPENSPLTRPDPASPEVATQPADAQREWNDILKFVDANSPNLATALRAVELPMDDSVRGKLVSFWREYTRLIHDNPKEAEIRLNTFRLWDEVFGLALQIRKFPDMEASLEPQLFNRLAQIADLAIAEQQLRIGLLEAALKDEQNLLKKEQDERLQVVNQRTKAVLNGIRRQTQLPIPYAPRLPATTPIMPSTNLPRVEVAPLMHIARPLTNPEVSQSQWLAMAIDLAIPPAAENFQGQ